MFTGKNKKLWLVILIILLVSCVPPTSSYSPPGSSQATPEVNVKVIAHGYNQVSDVFIRVVDYETGVTCYTSMTMTWAQCFTAAEIKQGR